MVTALMVLEAILAIALIVSVILQSGRSAGVSGTIAGGAEAIFGGKKKGLDEKLSKLTIILGFLFAVVTLVLVRALE